MPTCHGCRKSITGHYITALEYTWHAACFCCAGRGRVIGEQQFYTQNGQPYHAACFHKRFSPRGVLSAAANPSRVRRRRRWARPDPQHFVCSSCSQPFLGRTVYEKDGKVYCEKDYWETFGKRCAIGGEYLKGEFVVNGWGDAYCHAYNLGLPECYSCQRVICERLTSNQAEKYLCAGAHSQSITCPIPATPDNSLRRGSHATDRPETDRRL